MVSPILHRPPPPSKSPPRLKCPWCAYGYITDASTNACARCWESERRERAARARRRRAELIGRLARTLDAAPEEIVELIAAIAQRAQGGAA